MLNQELIQQLRNNELDYFHITPNMTDDEMSILADAMQHCTNLVSISFANRNLSSTQFTRFYASLTKLTKLEDLDLSNNKLDINAMEILGQVLSSLFETITRIDLSENAINDSALNILSEHLYHTTHLKYLNLGMNELRGENNSISTLSESLKQMKQLEVFVINGTNELQGSDARYLFEALSSLPQIQHINLLGNPVGNEGVRALCEFLPKMHNLVKIGIGNYISSKGFDELANCLEQCTDLKLREIATCNSGYYEFRDDPDEPETMEDETKAMDRLEKAMKQFYHTPVIGEDLDISEQASDDESEHSSNDESELESDDASDYESDDDQISAGQKHELDNDDNEDTSFNSFKGLFDDL